MSSSLDDEKMEEDVVAAVVVVAVTLKWSKQLFSLEFRVGESARNFKRTVEKRTGVPIERQTLLAKHGWKGTLKDDFVFEQVVNPKNKNKTKTTPLVVTLIGSADKLVLREPAAANAAATVFLEDLSPEQLLAAEQAEQQAAMGTAEGMITALQTPPHLRDDGKQEVYSYNRLVTGLPQRQIEELLRKRRRDDNQDDTAATTTVLGSVAMTLGAELRRAYVNDLAVLPQDGTLVSASDDGHVQLWRHGELVKDVIHSGGDGGVDSVVAFSKNSTNNNNNNSVAFVTAGRGCIRLWTTDAEPILALPTPSGTSPTSLVTLPVLGDDSTSASNSTTILVAARLQITRPSNPNQFRLLPQDDEGRRRRAQAQAEEAVIQETLERMARSIQVWFSLGNTNESLRSTLLEPQDNAGAAAISSLVALNNNDNNEGSSILVSGDVQGVVRLWKAQRTEESIHFEQQPQLFQLLSPQEDDEACSIQCMEALRDGRLAISTDRTTTTTVSENNRFVSSATDIRVPLPRAVYLMDVTTGTISVVLDGHKDVVKCLCELPNGDLLTGGGRFDATLQLWTSSQCKEQNDEGVRVVHSKPAKMLEDVGYVFSLAVLPDEMPGSTHFAVAAARYNVVKIVL